MHYQNRLIDQADDMSQMYLTPTAPICQHGINGLFFFCHPRPPLPEKNTGPDII